MDTPQHATQPPPVIMQPRQPQWPPPQYLPAPQYLPPPGPSREVRLEQAQARRSRAIALIAVGGALSLSGVILTGYYGGVDAIDGWTRGFALWGGITAFVVGVTLWAPGASSFVHASHTSKSCPPRAVPADGARLLTRFTRFTAPTDSARHAVLASAT